jgi:hypothetical protein
LRAGAKAASDSAAAAAILPADIDKNFMNPPQGPVMLWPNRFTENDRRGTIDDWRYARVTARVTPHNSAGQSTRAQNLLSIVFCRL